MSKEKHPARRRDSTGMCLVRSGVIVAALLCCGYARADAGQVVNGSFEEDGPIVDLTKRTASGWTTNLAVSVREFGGAVDATWSTDGRFSLLLFGQRYVPLQAGDMATVSQEIDLADVNEIVFDVRLDTYFGSPWDPNWCSAVVMIDQDVVWDTNDLASSGSTVALHEAWRVDDKYRDGQPHHLTLALRVNAASAWGLDDFYQVRWDAVRCSTFDDANGGNGEPNDAGSGDMNEVEFLPGDLNWDSFVNTDDLRMMAAEWLTEVPADSPYNLYTLYTGRPDADEEFTGIYTVNFFDLAVLARNWRAGPLPEP